MSALRMPDVVAHGRQWSGDELNAIAAAWLAVVGDALDESQLLIAVALPTGPEGVALLVALTSLPRPVILLPPDVRAWRTEPPIPTGTPLVLLSTLAHLAPHAETLGLVPLVLPEASARGAGRPIDAFSGAGIVLFTSGSSGRPKPIFHHMDSTVAWVRNLVRSIGLGPGDGVAMEASPAYAQGFTFLLTAILLAGPVGLLDARDHRLALATLAEPAFRCWRATPHFIDALSRCTLTGPAIVPPVCLVSTPIAKKLLDAFQDRFGVALRQMYSTTETGTITLDDSPADRIQRETVGRPIHQAEVRVGDRPSHPAAPDQVGRIWVRTVGLMAGYGFPPDLELRGVVDGWWPTEDLGSLRADGYLGLSGRRDDAIRTRDNRTVNLAHVAARLCEIDGVADALVVPIDTPSGWSFGAVVARERELTVGELRAKLADVLPSWSQPRVFALVPALPRLPNGKTDRLACGKLLGETASA